MAKLISSIYEFYKYVNNDLADPRTAKYPLVSSPWPTATLVCFYFYFCTNLGPKLMKNRQAFNLKSLMVVYNALQIFMSGFLFYQTLLYLWPSKYKFFCEPVNYSNDPDALFITRLGLLYYYQKIADLLDTVFFVLRKKTAHVNFLHLYHHSMMTLAGYVGTKYYPGGHLAFLGQINSFVHFVMYSYYLLTVIYPQNEVITKWKKHLTHVQMVQFLLVAFQSFPTLFWQDCEYPMWLRAGMTVQSIFMFFMFADFYKKAYSTSKKGT